MKTILKTGMTRFFFATSALLLCVTGMAKIVSAMGHDRILHTAEPLFGVSYRQLFWIVGVIEFNIGLLCFFNKQNVLRAAILTSLSAQFIVYRVGMWWLNVKTPCNCLGTLTGVLHIRPAIADTVLKWIIAYIFSGSCIVLWLCTINRQAENHGANTSGL